MAALPYSNNLRHRITWNVDVKKTVMETGAEIIETTLGLYPVQETTTLQWVNLTKAQVAEILNQFKAEHFLINYDFTLLGQPVKVRPTTQATVEERDHGLKCALSVAFRVVHA